MLTYTVLRLAIFAGCLGLLRVLGLRAPDQQLLLIVLAGALSMGISFFALRGPREALSLRISERVAARQKIAADDAAAEDREVG